MLPFAGLTHFVNLLELSKNRNCTSTVLKYSTTNRVCVNTENMIFNFTAMRKPKTEREAHSAHRAHRNSNPNLTVLVYLAKKDAGFFKAKSHLTHTLLCPYEINEERSRATRSTHSRGTRTQKECNSSQRYNIHSATPNVLATDPT